jgi:single-strand DNA-binding protein
MASYNRVVLLGNLTRDPELRYIPSGTAVSDIGLAVNDRVKRNNEWVDETTFVDITLWGRTAEVANEFLSKGSSVLIEGRLKLESWEKDGQKRSKLKVVADKMQMVGARGSGNQGGGGRSGSQQGQQSQGQPAQNDQYGGGEQSGGGQSDFNQQSAPGPSMPPSDEIPF